MTWKPLLALVVALVVGAGAVWLVLFSSVLAVEDVQVDGERTVTARQVLKIADVDEGSPLARVDVAAVEARIGSLGPVREVQVHRRWPHALVIEVEERVPVAVVDIGGTLRSLDADGVVFGSYPGNRAPSGLPRVDPEQGTTPRRCARPPRSWPRCPARWPVASTTSRSPRSTRSAWCCATAVASCGGARTTPRPRPESSPRC